jgi:hypothetical protein
MYIFYVTRPEESYRVSVCVWSRNPEKGGQRSVLDYKRLWMNIFCVSYCQSVNVTTLLKHPDLCYNLCTPLVPFAAFRLMTKGAESINWDFRFSRGRMWRLNPCGIAVCNLVELYRHFRGVNCVHLSSSSERWWRQYAPLKRRPTSVRPRYYMFKIQWRFLQNFTPLTQVNSEVLCSDKAEMPACPLFWIPRIIMALTGVLPQTGELACRLSWRRGLCTCRLRI